LTPVLVEEFRNSFDFDSDLTDFGTFGDLKRFLQYCVDRGWSSLTISLGRWPVSTRRGSRREAAPLHFRPNNTTRSSRRSGIASQLKLRTSKIRSATMTRTAFWPSSN